MMLVVLPLLKLLLVLVLVLKLVLVMHCGCVRDLDLELGIRCELSRNRLAVVTRWRFYNVVAFDGPRSKKRQQNSEGSNLIKLLVEH